MTDTANNMICILEYGMELFFTDDVSCFLCALFIFPLQGIGFGTDSMCLRMEADECPSGEPYAIIVKGDDVEERKLDYHGVGSVLDQSVVVRSNVVEGPRRIVELTVQIYSS